MMTGPGLTALEGFERANRAQREGRESQLRQGLTGLQLVDATQKMQRQNARVAAFKKYGPNDLEGLEGELIRQSDVQGADAVRKFREARESRAAVQRATRPDGSIDPRALPALAADKGQFGSILQYETARQAAEEKRQLRGRNQLAIGAIAGTEGASYGGTAPGSVGPLSQQGAMLSQQFAEEPQANAAAITEGLQTVAPARKGVFDAYFDHPDPIVRNTAMAGAQSVAMMVDPERAAGHTRAVMEQISRRLDRTEDRSQRAADRDEDRAFRREVFASRQQNPTSLMQNIKFLRESGIASSDQEAYRMARTAMDKPRHEAVLNLTQTLFRANSWRYGGDINKAAAEAEAFYDRMAGGGQKPAAGVPAGAQAPRSASSSVPPGYRLIGKEKGTGRPVYQGPDGQRYIEQAR